LKRNLPPVTGRFVQLEQLLVNLLNNAIDSVSSGGTITITTWRDAPAGMAKVSVRDNGPGLSAEVARRMFRPFFTTRPGGLGIGLMIARSIAEAHGGRLWAEGAPGGGTTFHFTVPFSN
jgi:two-component system sensor kinase FixL